MQSLPLWTPLASVALALAWLLPNAYPPWLAFHKDAWLAAVMCVVAIVWQCGERRARTAFRMDPIAAAFLAMALLAFVQWRIGIIHFFGHFSMALMYFGGAALAIVLGRDWAQRNRDQLGDFLFFALLVAAFATSFTLIVQWLQVWQWMGTWIQEVRPFDQPYGNLNQPNNAATLVVLGAVSVSWFAYRRLVNVRVWLIACSYLAFFIAITGSRIGYLTFSTLSLGVLVVGWRTGHLPANWRRAFIVLIFAFVAWVVLVHSNWGASRDLTLEGPRVFERDLTSIRLYLWRAYLHTAYTHPLIGFGFEQGMLTQMAAGEIGYQLNGLYTWSHNALLDIATWFGFPMFIVAVALIVWVVWRIFKSSADSSRWIFLAGVYAVTLHGLVELPLGFAYFLIPVCLMLGALFESLDLPSIAIPRIVVAVWTVSLATMLAALTYDYFRIEAAFYTWRFERSNIGKSHPQDIPDTLLLDQFEALLRGLRGSADSLTSRQVDEFERAIVHEPSTAAMQHLAEIRARQGDLSGAQRAADMAAITAQPKRRKLLAARWRYLTLQNPSFANVHWAE